MTLRRRVLLGFSLRLPCSKLLNACAPDAADERALNRPAGGAPELARGAALQNGALCINAAKALGCSLAGITPEDIVDSKVCIAHAPCWGFLDGSTAYIPF